MSDSNYEKVFKQYQEWFLRDNQEKTAEVENGFNVPIRSLFWRTV